MVDPFKYFNSDIHLYDPFEYFTSDTLYHSFVGDDGRPV